MQRSIVFGVAGLVIGLVLPFFAGAESGEPGGSGGRGENGEGGDGFVRVRAATFLMGEKPGANSRESDAEEEQMVTLTRDFWAAPREVTHREYVEFLNSAGVSSEGEKYGRPLVNADSYMCTIQYREGRFLFEGADDVDSEDMKEARHAVSPESAVIHVTWYGAAAYANWLSEQRGLSPVYDTDDWSCDFSADGYRLPTEAEWEYAARGGHLGDPTRFAGGDDLDEVAWYRGNMENGKVQPVGRKEPNELGLYDMSGNVVEWCWDRHGSYSQEAVWDPRGAEPAEKQTPQNLKSRILRGGFWGSFPKRCTVFARGAKHPYYSSCFVGFRLVRG